MRVRFYLLAGVVGILLWALTGLASVSAENLDSSAYPASLAAAGWPPSDYEVVCSWTEMARNGEGPLLKGCRLTSRLDGSAFDVYLDETNRVVDEAGLSHMGIRPKDWRPCPILVRAETTTPCAKSGKPTPEPVSVREGLGPAAYLDLPAVDIDALLFEDETPACGEAKCGQRAGVFQEFMPLTVEGMRCSMGAWRPIGNGRLLWSVVIHSTGAVGQRVHLTRFNLPPGAEVFAFNINNPQEAYGPFDRSWDPADDLWLPTCFAEDVAIECSVSTTEVGKVALTIDKTLFMYRGADLLAFTKGIAGSCNLDVTCYPRYEESATAVALLSIITKTGSKWCTASLLADTDQDTQIPYVLTAYHCVGNQTQADHTEYYWFYQTAVCDGDRPSLALVPRTQGGADFLAGASRSGGTDFAFLRLREEPPPGVALLGWSAARQSEGTDVTCIHHPQGDFKRITFGNIVPDDDQNFYKIHWHDGTTEPGSSGSPLLNDDALSVVGQLYGGGASCTYPDEPDYYGSFCMTFPIVQQWLAPGPPTPDIDYSGSVNAVDVQLVINAALGISIAPYRADVDGSDSVNAVDVQLVINAALGTS